MQYKYLLFTLIHFSLFIACGCNKLLYETPMPQSGVLVTDFATNIEGQYLLSSFDSNAVYGILLTITNTTPQKYVISSTNLIFLDSVTSQAEGIDSIIDVTVNDNHLEIKTKNQIYSKAFTDTISSDSSFYYYEIDLDKGYFDFLLEKGRKPCHLRLSENTYYLNIQYFDQYWLVSSVKIEKNQLKIKKMHTHLGADSPVFEQLNTKYRLDSLKVPSKWHHFLLQSDDQEMKNLFQEDFLPKEVWQKIHP